MRNLVRFDLEKLDNLPTKGKLYDTLNSSLDIKRDKEYKDRYSEKYKLAARILDGSIGKNASAVYHKIKPLVKNYGSNYSGKNWWRSHTTLDNSGSYIDYGIYIDNQNIIRYKAYVRKKRFREKITRKDWYEKLSAARKRERDRNKLLNQGDRFSSDLSKSNVKAKYFLSLLRDKQKRVDIINTPKPEYPSSQHKVWYAGGRKLVDKTPVQFQKDIDKWKISLEEYANKKELALRELDEINTEIESFRNKNLTNFYQSYLYINSVKKECHHYEQP